jgi:hypothetical protein
VLVGDTGDTGSAHRSADPTGEESAPGSGVGPVLVALGPVATLAVGGCDREPCGRDPVAPDQ